MAIDASAARFLMVGVGNAAVGLGVIYFAKAIGIGDVVANAFGYAFGLVLSFMLNKRWTFQHDGPVLGALVRFIGVVGLAYFANLGIVLVAIRVFGINSYLAQAFGIPAYTAITYLGSRWYAFPPRIQVPE